MWWSNSFILGNGTYEIVDSFLVIHTKEYTKEKRIINETKTLSDTTKVYITNMKGEIIRYAQVCFFDSLNKYIGIKDANKDGLVIFPYNSKIRKLSVMYVGYSPMSFDYKKNTNYNVSLFEGRVSENETVVLKIYSITNESIVLALLSEDYNEKKDKLKQLRSLENEYSCHKKEFKK